MPVTPVIATVVNMDATTVQAYDVRAPELAAGMRRFAPEMIYVGLSDIFHAGRATADIGCGSGRDAAWLQALGYQVVGYDASTGMLHEARTVFPDSDLRQDSLPDLAYILDGAYWNVLCSAVLMHLPQEDLPVAMVALARILVPGGRLFLTFRQRRETSEREEDGRLFTAVAMDTLALLLESSGFQILLRSVKADELRPDVHWARIGAERNSS